MALKQSLISTDKYNIKCPYSMNPIGICIHNTYNDASANNEITYMKRNNNQVSFHIAIDDKEAIQAIPLNRNAWAAGDGSSGKGNRNYIHIEICYSKSGGTKFINSEKMAAKEISQILKNYNWGIDRIKKHQDFSNKYCPHRTLDMGWERFINLIKAELKLTNSNSNFVEKSVLDGKKFIGSRAKELQEKLIKLSYNCGPFGADGQYGPDTHKALIKFQKDNSLTPDGLAGRETFSKIDEQILKNSQQSSSNSSSSNKVPYYRVICGSYTDRENANKIVRDLKLKGFNSFIDVFFK